MLFSTFDCKLAANLDVALENAVLAKINDVMACFHYRPSAMAVNVILCYRFVAFVDINNIL